MTSSLAITILETADMPKINPEFSYSSEEVAPAIESLKQSLELQFVFLGTLGDVVPGLRVALAMKQQGWDIHCSIPNDPSIVKFIQSFPDLKAVTTTLPVDFIQMINGISESFYEGKALALLPNMFQVLTVDQVAEIMAGFKKLLDQTADSKKTVVLGNGIAEGLLSALITSYDLPFITLSPNILADPNMAESSYLPLPNYILVPLLRLALNTTFSRQALGKVTGEKGKLWPVPRKLGSVYTIPPFAQENPRSQQPTYQVDYTGFEAGQEPVNPEVAQWLEAAVSSGKKIWLVSPGSLTPNMDQVVTETLAYPDANVAFLFIGVNSQFTTAVSSGGAEGLAEVATAAGGKALFSEHYLPYHWLMPLIARSQGGVVSHHGSGVSAIAREHAVPVIRLPLFVDSGFFAALTERALQQVANLKYQVPTIPLKQFSTERLKLAIEYTNRPEVRDSYQVLAEYLRARRDAGELGVDAATMALTDILLSM
jgi:hypothetical protein